MNVCFFPRLKVRRHPATFDLCEEEGGGGCNDRSTIEMVTCVSSAIIASAQGALVQLTASTRAALMAQDANQGKRLVLEQRRVDQFHRRGVWTSGWEDVAVGRCVILIAVWGGAPRDEL